MSGGGGQGGCVRRIQVIVTIKKESGQGGPVGAVRVNVPKELKLL